MLRTMSSVMFSVPLDIAALGAVAGESTEGGAPGEDGGSIPVAEDGMAPEKARESEEKHRRDDRKVLSDADFGLDLNPRHRGGGKLNRSRSKSFIDLGQDDAGRLGVG